MTQKTKIKKDKISEQVRIVDINNLVPHEKICRENLEKVKLSIKTEKIIKEPILVDKKTNVILDGHHRYNSLLELGCSKIPVLLVNYQSKEVKLDFFRNIYQYLTKDEILECAKCGNLFPKKTTKHTHNIKKIKIKIRLNQLI